jgi:hypothetical protein
MFRISLEYSYCAIHFFMYVVLKVIVKVIYGNRPFCFSLFHLDDVHVYSFFVRKHGLLKFRMIHMHDLVMVHLNVISRLIFFSSQQLKKHERMRGSESTLLVVHIIMQNRKR